MTMNNRYVRMFQFHFVGGYMWCTLSVCATECTRDPLPSFLPSFLLPVSIRLRPSSQPPLAPHQPQPQGVPGVPEQGAAAGAEVPRRPPRLPAVAGQRQDQHGQMLRRASKCGRGLHRSAKDPGTTFSAQLQEQKKGKKR